MPKTCCAFNMSVLDPKFVNKLRSMKNKHEQVHVQNWLAIPIQTATNWHSQWKYPQNEQNQGSEQTQNVRSERSPPQLSKGAQVDRTVECHLSSMQCRSTPHPWDEEVKIRFPTLTFPKICSTQHKLHFMFCVVWWVFTHEFVHLNLFFNHIQSNKNIPMPSLNSG